MPEALHHSHQLRKVDDLIHHLVLNLNSRFSLSVQQTTDQTFPEHLLIVINRNGVSLVNPKSKNVSLWKCVKILDYVCLFSIWARQALDPSFRVITYCGAYDCGGCMFYPLGCIGCFVADDRSSISYPGCTVRESNSVWLIGSIT